MLEMARAFGKMKLDYGIQNRLKFDLSEMYFRMWFRLEAEKEFSVLQLGCRRVRPNRLIRVGRTARQSVEPKSCGLPQRRHCRRRYYLLYCRCRHYRWGNDSVFGIDVNIFLLYFSCLFAIEKEIIRCGDPVLRWWTKSIWRVPKRLPIQILQKWMKDVRQCLILGFTVTRTPIIPANPGLFVLFLLNFFSSKTSD